MSFSLEHNEERLAWIFGSSRSGDVVDSWLDAYREGSWAISGGTFPVSAEGRIPLNSAMRARPAR